MGKVIRVGAEITKGGVKFNNKEFSKQGVRGGRICSL